MNVKALGGSKEARSGGNPGETHHGVQALESCWVGWSTRSVPDDALASAPATALVTGLEPFETSASDPWSRPKWQNSMETGETCAEVMMESPGLQSVMATAANPCAGTANTIRHIIA